MSDLGLRTTNRSPFKRGVYFCFVRRIFVVFRMEDNAGSHLFYSVDVFADQNRAECDEKNVRERKQIRGGFFQSKIYTFLIVYLSIVFFELTMF